jgi:acyl-CoA reductase-like NAD-dependent aldehyde dehydrogenase
MKNITVGESNSMSNPETEADSSIWQHRLERLRKSVDAGVDRPISWRLAQLDALLRFVDDHENSMLDALKADLGRCRAEGRMADVSMVRSEIRVIQRNLRRWLRPRRVRTPLAAQPGRSWVQPEPFGLALIFGTWNYPFQQVLIPLAGALAAGNAAVIKLAESAPHAAALMATHLERYVDSEAVHVVSGGPETASRLLAYRFDKIFFTGSSRIGRVVMAAAAANLTPVTLELGGKNPVIVAEDAPLEVTARRIVWGRFMNTGQLCVAPDYVLVPEHLRLPLIEAIRRAILSFYGPDPQQSDSYGRIVNEVHVARLIAFLKEGRIAIGGTCDEKDRYIAPTVLTDLPPDAAVLQDEIFGPILPVVGYRQLDEALAYIRNRPKPLVFHLFTRDRRLQERLIRSVSAGSVIVNDVVINQIIHGLPFGGVGESGMGSFHGRYTFEAFSHAKAVVRRSLRADLSVRYPPFTSTKDRILKLLLS